MKRRGTLKLDGAHCASCTYTIEHIGRKIKGIDEVRVHSAEQRIDVDYQGSSEVLDKITDIVETIGYEAYVVTVDETDRDKSDN